MSVQSVRVARLIPRAICVESALHVPRADLEVRRMRYTNHAREGDRQYCLVHISSRDVSVFSPMSVDWQFTKCNY